MNVAVIGVTAWFSEGKAEGFALSCELCLKCAVRILRGPQPVVLSTPSKRPDVIVCVIASSLRQVTVVPTSTVVVDGLKISELRVITGPVGAAIVLVGASGGVPW